MPYPTERYHRSAIWLHWGMAVCIIGMLAGGLAMSSGLLEKSLQFRVYQWHKSLGVILLWAVTFRVFIRLRHAPPPLPAGIGSREAHAAKLGHLLLYVLMVGLPFSGWLMVSASATGMPTLVFGLFEWPHIPGLSANAGIRGVAHEGHEIMAYVMIALIATHVAAVVKHRWIDNKNLLPRMGIGTTSGDAHTK